MTIELYRKHVKKIGKLPAPRFLHWSEILKSEVKQIWHRYGKIIYGLLVRYIQQITVKLLTPPLKLKISILLFKALFYYLFRYLQ